MGRVPRTHTVICRELERTDLSVEQRMRLIEMLSKIKTGGVPKGTKPPRTGKIKKPSRNFSDADIARLRGNEEKPEKKVGSTLGDFLKDES